MLLSLCLSLAMACVEHTAPHTRPDVVYYRAETWTIAVREYTPVHIPVSATLPEQSDSVTHSRLASNDFRRDVLRCTIGVA